MELTFSENLRTLRRQEGLTQSELAAKLNVTQRKVAYWESGKIEPNLRDLWKICDLFDVSADFLMGRKKY